jgi:CRISPR-associated endonuclease/helicase Cas3
MSASVPFDAQSKEPIAHLDPEGGGRAHPLREHLAQVGRLAGAFARAFGSTEVAEIAGFLHDIGKFSARFQRNIREENGFTAHIEGDISGPRDHSTAGAILAQQLSHLSGDIRTALAFAIAGHHAGLGDLTELRRRLANTRLLDDALAGGFDRGEAARLKAARPSWLPAASSEDGKRRLEMWIRMLFSCLCDADFLDTEAFYDAARSRLRTGWPALDLLEQRIVSYVDALERAAPVSTVNAVRREIRAAAISSAELAPGFFTLTVPTGGGKTLVSMEFALRHARYHGLERVIVAVPLTAILEQNAEVYRAALGADAVLEHHSSVDIEDPRRETPRTRVASENWDAPVVVTTTVQLFESLFSNRASRCRKLHNLVRSVIVLDEAQAFPPQLLATILDGLSTLVRDYGVSVVISTATQPAFNRRASFPQGIEGAREIVPAGVRAFERLRRVRVEWPRGEPCTQWPELADQLAAHPDVLCIVHRRRDALELTRQLDERLSDQSTVHLSALMCPSHRSKLLLELKAARVAGKPTRVVSTQLIEAGVDVDFPVVYRALGGLDSIAQAAGRCNREGRLAEGLLRVFRAPSQPPVGLPRSALAVTQAMLADEPPLIDDPKAFERFFRALYPVVNLDRHELQKARAAFDFRKVGHLFRMIENDWSAPVVVPWGDAEELLHEWRVVGANRETWRKLQRLTVNVPRVARDRWLAEGMAEEVEGVVAVVPGALAYDERFGLRLDAEGVHSAASLVIDE